jgi:hypothetical protein
VACQACQTKFWHANYFFFILVKISKNKDNFRAWHARHAKYENWAVQNIQKIVIFSDNGY